MALAIATVCDSIAALNVQGVTIKDVDNIPEAAIRLYPLLFPEPVDFVTNFVMTRQSYGGGSSAKYDVEYDLHYTFLYAPAGTGLGGVSLYEGALDKAALILDAVLAIDTIDGAIDIVPSEVTEFGPVPDPAGNMYIGCRMRFHVLEFGANG